MIFKNISKNEMMTLFPTEINIYLIQRKYVRHARASMLVSLKDGSFKVVFSFLPGPQQSDRGRVTLSFKMAFSSQAKQGEIIQRLTRSPLDYN